MIAFRTDHSRGLAEVLAEGEVSGRDHLQAIRSVLDADPRLMGYDFCYDLTRHAGGVTHDALAELRTWLAARFPDPPQSGLTLILSPDTGYRHRVPLMARPLPHRRIAWVPTMASAQPLLAEAAARRRASQPEAQSPPPISQP